MTQTKGRQIKYLAGTVFAGVAVLFCYLLATATDEQALGFGVGVLMSAMLASAAAWLGYTLRK